MHSSYRFLPIVFAAAISLASCGKKTTEDPAAPGGAPADGEGGAGKSTTGSTPAPAPKAGPTYEQVNADLQKVLAAVFVSDMESVATYTHPKIFELVGGREQFMEQIGKVFDQTKAAGVRFGGATVGKEIDYFTGTENEFLLVFAEVSVEVAGNITKQSGHQLGVKKKGEAGWKYLDCSALNTQMARDWFPDFPADREIPKPAEMPTTRPPEGHPAP